MVYKTRIIMSYVDCLIKVFVDIYRLKMWVMSHITHRKGSGIDYIFILQGCSA